MVDPSGAIGLLWTVANDLYRSISRHRIAHTDIHFQLTRLNSYIITEESDKVLASLAQDTYKECKLVAIRLYKLYGAAQLWLEANKFLGEEYNKLGTLKGREREKAIEKRKKPDRKKHPRLSLTDRAASLKNIMDAIAEESRALASQLQAQRLEAKGTTEVIPPTEKGGESDGKRKAVLLQRSRGSRSLRATSDPDDNGNQPVQIPAGEYPTCVTETATLIEESAKKVMPKIKVSDYWTT